ncbi:TonB-dependent receptor plug domain-containing protein [Colwelliaceae bacterium 6441]
MRFKYSKINLALIACALSTTVLSAEEVVDEEVETIQVTGSRIQRSSAATPVPTTVIDAQQIEQLGFTNTGDLLNSLPAISGSVGARSGSGGTGDAGAGLELANLRGLGVDRTLVLVNGRRHVGSSVSNTSIDVGTIPVQMIERVEVITGAAGAVYGADAVSGVVNFIMKKSYDGFKADVKYGETSEGDGEEVTLSLLGGLSFDNGKGNLMASLDYTDRQNVHSKDRSWSKEAISWVNSEVYTENSGLPQKRIGYDIGFTPLNNVGVIAGTPFGYVPSIGGLGYGPIGDLAPQTLNPDGTLKNYDPGACATPFSIPCEGGDNYKTHPYDNLSVPTERIVASVVASYEVGDDHEIFADIKYSNTTGNTQYQGGLAEAAYGPIAVVNRNNPYLAPYTSVTSAMDAAGLDHVYVGKAFDSFDNTIENKFETIQMVFGASGDLSDEIGYDFTVQYGQTNVTLKQHSFYVDKFLQGTNVVADGNGNPVCADTSGGCQPINPFGYKSVSAEASAWVRDDLAQRGELNQFVANFSINGDLYELDAGAIQFAAGLEYRKEESKSTPDKELTQMKNGHGLVGVTWGGPMQAVSGDYDVSEIFAEVLVPLVTDASFAQDLTFEAALRYSDYSTVGGQTAYKFGLDWVLNDEVRFRTSHGLAVRAPNVGELFQPETVVFEKINDPCSSSYINTGSNTVQRKANCASFGIPEDWTAFTEGGEAAIYKSGNANLAAEESTTSSFGIVLTPAEGFSIALDYWDIQIDEAISTPTTGEILNNCYDFSNMDTNAFCTLSTRDGANADLPFEISSLRNQKVNVAELSAKGYDVEVNYQVDVGAGSLLFNLVGSYYDKRDQVVNANKPDEVVEGVDILNNPKARGYFSTTYRQDNWNANLTFNYLGSSKIAVTDSADPIYPSNHVDSVIYVNLRGAYTISDNIEAYAGVSNLMDKGPQLLPGLTQGSNIYDAIGRSFYLGATYEF